MSLVDQLDPVEDLYHLVNTLAVGRVAVIGVGQGACDALAFAARPPDHALYGARHLAAQLQQNLRPGTTGGLAQVGRRPPPSPWAPVAEWLRATGRGVDLTSEKTWQRATRRMDPRSARVLGQRWQDPAFRQGLADDANYTAASWTTPVVSSPPMNWEKINCQVPVRIWHGRDETGTSLAHVRDTANPYGWQVTAVDGCSALFGSWQQILTAAADSFHLTAA